MKNVFFKLIIISIIFSMDGCYKLEQVNPNELSENNFWKNENDLYKGAMAAYDGLQAGLYNDKIPIFFMGISDEATHESHQEFEPIVRFQIPDYNFFQDFWNQSYGMINRAYQVIDHAPSITGQSVPALTAEMRFLVCLSYYNLVSFFGENIAYVDKTQFAADKPRKAETGELWKFMQDQLILAIPDLPLAREQLVDQYGRVTKGAAQALLAKVYMQQHNYAAAEPLLKEIIDSHQYQLLPDYADNFVIRNTVNPESVFQVNFIANGPSEESDNTTRFLEFSPGEGQGAYGDFQPTAFILNSYLSEKDASGGYDSRLNVTLFWEKSPGLYYGKPYSWWVENGGLGTIGDPDVNTSYYKYSEQATVATEVDNIATDKDGGTDFIVIRYSDVLLSYAECLNETGATNEAYQYVDEVRARSNMKPLAAAHPEIGNDKSKFLKQLQHERVVELAGECVRIFDQKRWGIFNQADAVNDPNFSTFKAGQSEVEPIPQYELDLNPNLKQNPGY